MTLFGEELFLYDAASEGASAILLDLATLGAIYQKFQLIPRTLKGFGVRVTTAFNYHTPTQLAVITLYRYPGGNAANKVALGSITLTDGIAANEVFYCDALNRPADIQPATPGPALGYVGDVFAIELTQAGQGGTYPSGDYQPYMVVTNRGETRSPLVQPLLIDQSPVVI